MFNLALLLLLLADGPADARRLPHQVFAGKAGEAPKFEYELGEISSSGGNDEDPVPDESGTGTVTVVYTVGHERRDHTVESVDLQCHGAGCGASFSLDGKGAYIGEPELAGLAPGDIGKPNWAAHIPPKTVATLGVVYETERAYFLYSLYHLVAVDAAHYKVLRQRWMSDMEDPLEDGLETLLELD